ncbi:hypothetical protein [Hymenobacter weizhouensis]|uniref:hypothetical protein n=1 Tax=Hymenobacter sp. YIM 151500-1 TaxID=2987689 RepID=UPI002226D912|nr:hypothetical protein [Hymenobacter sp. YIM 151500-1]UYZ63183.1 hypothetical protein OIS53_19600 [Hymenobacter sp. YIM 151500-1]
MVPEAVFSDIAARVRRHTAYTVVGGVFFLFLIFLALFVLSVVQSKNSRDLGGMFVYLVGICILPAWLFALLRQPPMRRLFREALLQPARWRRVLLLTLGTAGIFLAYVAGATVLVVGFLYVVNNGPFGMLLKYYSIAMFGLSFPWLLSAVAAACYVNRDLLRLSYTPLLTLRKKGS